MPIPKDIHRAYAEYYTHVSSPPQIRGIHSAYRDLKNAYIRSRLGYGGAPAGWALAAAILGRLHPGGAAELARDAAYLPAPVRDGHVLEVGCGGGETLITLRELGWSVAGSEVDPKAVAAARARGLDVRLGDLAAIGFPAQSFDAICVIHVIEHVHDPRKLLIECRRLLRPDGQLLILTPNADSAARRQFGAAWVSLDPPRHLHIFEPHSLRRVLEECGLAVTQLTTTARGARAVWFQGREIARHGRWDATRAPTLLQHAMGIPFQLRMRISVADGAQVGEELLAWARVGPTRES